MIKIAVPATSANMGPGFDTFGIALGYYNYISVSEAEVMTLAIEGQGRLNLQSYKDNLIFRSFKSVYDRLGKKMPEVSLLMENNIPITRGMGSSAAAIAGGIFAANALLGQPLTMAEMLHMAAAAEGHPDNVAPALLGGFVASGVFETGVKTLRLLPPKELKVVAAVPEFRLPTKRAREVLPRELPLKDVVFNVSRASLLLGALATGDLDLFKSALEDRIHHPYRFNIIPGAELVVKAAMDNGAIGCVLSGSGSTMLAFTLQELDNENKIGQGMVRAFSRRNLQAHYLALAIDTEGARIV